MRKYAVKDASRKFGRVRNALLERVIAGAAVALSDAALAAWMASWSPRPGAPSRTARRARLGAPAALAAAARHRGQLLQLDAAQFLTDHGQAQAGL